MIIAKTRRADQIRRGRRRHQSIVAIGIAALLNTAVAHAQGGTGLDSATRFGNSTEPFSSDSDLLGATTTAPFVTVNEFTGKVSIRLPSIGVPGLSLTPSYVAPNRRELDEADPFPYHEEYKRSPLGIAWHLDMGFLISRQGTAASSTSVHPTWERVAYVDPGGNFTAFTRDGIFQDIPDGGHPTWWGDHCPPNSNCNPTDDARFIDSSLRRITRDVGPPGAQAPVFNGSGVYTLREPSGRRIEFQPTTVLATSDFSTYVYSYPVGIVEPNGRELKICYVADNATLIEDCQPPPMNSRPRIDYIEDSFQRRLVFTYTDNEYVDKYVDQVSLQDGKGTHQLLATFTYQEDGDDVHLRSIKTPEGYETLIGLQDPESIPPAQLFSFVDTLTLPQGGLVKLAYTEISIDKEVPLNEFGCHSKYNCLNPTTREKLETWVRVERLEHSGGVYLFRYSQHADDAIPKPTGWEEEYPYSPLTVTVEQADVPPGEKIYSRKTTFFGFPTSHGAYTVGQFRGDSLLLGRPALRTEEYCERGSALDPCDEQKEERWIYTHNTTLACNDGFCRGLHFRSGGTAEAGATWLPQVRKYSLQVDGEWTDTVFEFDSLGVQWGTQIQTNLIYPTAIEMNAVPSQNQDIDPPCAGGSVALRQEFEYLHRPALGEPPMDFALGLLTYANQSVGGLTLQEIETDYHPSWPLPKQIRRFVDDNDTAVVTDLSYFEPPHADSGLLEYQTTGGSQFGESVKEYTFGIPSRVEPLAGLLVAPPTLREVDADGTLASETQNGVRLEYQYDLDRRLTQTFYPLDLPQSVGYSPPLGGGVPPTKVIGEGCEDNWMNASQANRSSWECLDEWGRVVRTETAVADSPMELTAVGRIEFNAIGLPTRSISAQGAVTETEYDVWGRPVEVRIHDESGPANDQLGYRSFKYSIDPPTGIRRVEETFRVDKDNNHSIVRITDTDLAGRTVAAGLRRVVGLDAVDAPRTCFLYQDADDDSGATKISILPGGGPEGGLARYRWVNWLGQIVKEYHPEIGYTHYRYDSRGLLRERHNTQLDDPGDPQQSERHRFTYDAVNRLVREEVKDGETYVEVRRFSYNHKNNQLEESRGLTDDAGRAVVTRFDPLEFDEQQRPKKLAITIPEPYEPLDGLRPRGAFLDDRPTLLRWHGHQAAERYSVQLRPLGMSTVVFETAVAELSLDVGVLDATKDYEWRVRMLTREHEPSPWSEWVKLRNGCRIESFETVPGYGQGPFIWWRTSECEDSHYTVRVLASTVEGTTTPACALTDGLFSAHLNGIPQQAHFMANGYTYADVAAAHAWDPDYVPNYFDPRECSPIDEADFRITITDNDTDEVVDERPAKRARVVDDPNACQITAFYVNDGFTVDLTGELEAVPEVTWRTRNCSGRHVEVRRSTVGPEIDPNCELFEDTWALAPEGQQLAEFMAAGWTGTPGVQCDPVAAAEFSLIVRRTSDPESEILDARAPILGRIDPDHGDACHIRYFGTSFPSDLPPEVRWHTHGCDQATVEVQTSTVAGVVIDDCGLRHEIFSEHHQGPLEALFMATGYPGRNGVDCGLLRQADFAMEVFEEGGAHFDRRAPIRAEYTGDQQVPPNDPRINCEVSSFEVTNNGNRVPLVEWSTTCDQPDSLIVSVRASTIGSLPAGCGVENGDWGGGSAVGDKEADFMVGGYGPNHACPPVENVDFWIVLRTETGEELVTTAKKRGTYLPGQDPSCSVLSFDVESFPGEQRLPEVKWSTDCSPNGSISVQVRTEALVPAPCRLEDQLWDGSKTLPDGRPVNFMVGGRGPNCACPPLDYAWFWIELVDTSAGDRLVRRTDNKLATYEPPAQPICELLSCGVTNSPGVLPFVAWQTSCENVSGSIVRVKTSTLSVAEPPECVVDNGTFDGNHEGARPADYMVGGYDPNQTCPPVAESAFWVQVSEELAPGVERLVRQSDFMIGTYDAQPPVCKVVSFNVLDHPAGEVPTVSWHTDCEGADQVSVQVLTTTVGNLPADCKKTEHVWDTRFSASAVPAHFMLAGAGADCHCPAAEQAWFQVQIRKLSDGSLVHQSDDKLASYSPVVPCGLLSCSVSDPPVGQLPEISWSTDCPDPGTVSVQTKTTTVSSLPFECELQDAMWDANKNQSRQPYYMAGGNGPTHSCPPVEQAVFRTELWHGSTLAAQSDDMLAEYAPPASPCEVQSFTVSNGAGGEVPTVTWSTNCSGQNETVQVLVSTLGNGGAGCDWDGHVWQQSTGKSLAAQFMADGLGPGCSDIGEAAFWLRIVDTANPPSILYRQTSFAYGEYQAPQLTGK